MQTVYNEILNGKNRDLWNPVENKYILAVYTAKREIYLKQNFQPSREYDIVKGARRYMQYTFELFEETLYALYFSCEIMSYNLCVCLLLIVYRFATTDFNALCNILAVVPQK